MLVTQWTEEMIGPFEQIETTLETEELRSVVTAFHHARNHFLVNGHLADRLDEILARHDDLVAELEIQLGDEIAAGEYEGVVLPPEADPGDTTSTDEAGSLFLDEDEEILEVIDTSGGDSPHLPDFGTDAPADGAEAIDFGTDTPADGAEAVDFGTDAPADAGTDNLVRTPVDDRSREGSLTGTPAEDKSRTGSLGGTPVKDKSRTGSLGGTPVKDRDRSRESSLTGPPSKTGAARPRWQDRPGNWPPRSTPSSRTPSVSTTWRPLSTSSSRGRTAGFSTRSCGYDSTIAWSPRCARTRPPRISTSFCRDSHVPSSTQAACCR